MKFLLYTTIIILTFGCFRVDNIHYINRKKLVMNIVIFNENINPNSEWDDEILVKDSVINRDNAIIDLYYISTISDIPYYLPTNGFLKDTLKDKECDYKKYPAHVKCYKYDSINRVTSMNIDGSGVMGEWQYKYDELSRVIEIKEGNLVYSISYFKDLNLIAEISYISHLKRKGIKITYDK